jgi:hypothetical protein
MHAHRTDEFGALIARKALETFVRICPQQREATDDQREAACAAMRAKARPVLDQLLSDAKAAPHLGQIVFTSAVLEIAQEGARVIREQLAAESANHEQVERQRA